jgi:hypothetical protein
VLPVVRTRLDGEFKKMLTMPITHSENRRKVIGIPSESRSPSPRNADRHHFRNTQLWQLLDVNFRYGRGVLRNADLFVGTSSGSRLAGGNACPTELICQFQLSSKSSLP